MSKSQPTKPFQGKRHRRQQQRRPALTARYLSLQEPQLSLNVARFAAVHRAARAGRLIDMLRAGRVNGL